jgi:uncharacterized membrane protein YgcG
MCECHRFSRAVVKLLFGVILAAALIYGASAHAQNQRVIRLSVVDGKVQILASNQTVLFESAVANMPLTQGNFLQTSADGKAELQFEDGSIVRLVPNSELQLVELKGDNPGHLKTTIEVFSGEAYFEARPAKGDKFEVRAGGDTIRPNGNGSFRINLAATPAQIAVSDGDLQVSHGGDYSATVQANQTLSLDSANPAKYLIAEGTSSSEWDQWNEDRDNLMEAQANQATDAQSGGDAAGWDDLDYYGSWYPVPGVGLVWQPYAADANWDPYDGGYWADNVWISGYSWGWLPYHCGYWDYFDDFGWGWIGGGCGIGVWYGYTPWYNGPGWWRHPIIPKQPNPRNPHVPIPLVAVGKTVAHPGQPLPAQPAPTGGPRVATVHGHQIKPLAAIPRAERSSAAFVASKAAADRGEAPQTTWHGGASYTRPTPHPVIAPPPHYDAGSSGGHSTGGGHFSSGGSGGHSSGGGSSGGGGGSHR